MNTSGDVGGSIGEEESNKFRNFLWACKALHWHLGRKGRKQCAVVAQTGQQIGLREPWSNGVDSDSRRSVFQGSGPGDSWQ
jgi:hypothetical protein